MVDKTAVYLIENLHHERVKEVHGEQLIEANFEDEDVREQLEPVLLEDQQFGDIFDELSSLADDLTARDNANTWKDLVEKNVNICRVNAFFYAFIDKALSKNSVTRDVEYGIAASCAWLKLAGQKGATLFHFFNQYLYKMTLDVIRLVFRVRMYGSRSMKMKKKAKGKKGGKKNAAPMREEDEEDEEFPLDFNTREMEAMLDKACEALYVLLNTTALSQCPAQANDTADLLRELMRIDIGRDTVAAPVHSIRDLRSRDLLSDRCFALAHVLAEPRHSFGGIVAHSRLVFPRLLFLTWEGDVVPSTQSIPAAMTVARDVALSFVKERLLVSTDENELEVIAKIACNLMARCPERSEYRQRVAQSVLELLALLPKKACQDQLQLVYTLGLHTKTGLRAMAVEMIPTILTTLDLDEIPEEAEPEKSKRDKKKNEDGDSDNEEDEENEEEKKKKKNDMEEDEDDDDDEDGNTTKRKAKNKEKKKKRKDDSESDVADEDEEDGGNTTKRKVKKDKQRGKKVDEAKGKKKKIRKGGSDSEDEEEEEDGNTTRRKRAAKDQSILKIRKQKGNEDSDDEEDDESEEEGDGKKSRKKVKKEDEKKAKSKRVLDARVVLRPGLLTLMIRACMDKVGNVRARALQQVAVMVEKGAANDLREAADELVRSHPRIFTQVVAGHDDSKADEEMDEEEKARAKKLAEIAAADMKIENGLLHVVMQRMEDDVAAVRRAAIAALQPIFLQSMTNTEHAMECADALKLRCLDTSLMVRKQAMDTLSYLLSTSLMSEFRPVLESTWLRAVLPLINDRENSVQAMAARLVEEHLITPIMQPNTPDPCWHMLERVEQEVSNRRLLVRTLAYLSQQNSIKEKVVEVLNEKLETDVDHCNVIWMLLADLSTVFKIDPRKAIITWLSLKPEASENMVAYVAKIIGEGALKMNDSDRNVISKDIEDKLISFSVHAPHIATVYLALARLMDAVGELASGTDVLERFGKDILNRSSRKLYDDLKLNDVVFDKTKEEIEIDPRDEITVIRIVCTIGEVVQLSPSLIDMCGRLIDGLRLIMASELFTAATDFILNSWVPSNRNTPIPPPMSSQGTQGSSQENPGGDIVQLPYAPSSQGTIESRASQLHVLPEELYEKIKKCSLKVALFTPTVRRYTMLTIGKFCLMDEKLAKACLLTIVKMLKFNPDHVLRNNIVIVLCDLCIRYTLLVDRYVPIIASCLKDRSTLVRQQTLECLTILIKEAFIRWEGQIMYRFVSMILDEDRKIREYATFCLKDILFPQMPCMYYNHFVECLLYFNDVPRKYKSNDSIGDAMDAKIKFSLSGKQNEDSRMKLYDFMISTFDDKQKFITMAKISEEIFSSVYTGELSIDDEKTVALLTDAFKVMSCENMQLRLECGKKDDGDDDEAAAPAPQAVQDAAKNMITTVFRTAIINSIMPHVLELRRFLILHRHPIMKYLMGVLRALTRSHMDQLQEFFAGDRIALREIEYDIKRINSLEEKLKLRAAQKAKEAEERARNPPSRRQSMLPPNTTAAPTVDVMNGSRISQAAQRMEEDVEMKSDVATGPANASTSAIDVEMPEEAGAVDEVFEEVAASSAKKTKEQRKSDEVEKKVDNIDQEEEPIENGVESVEAPIEAPVEVTAVEGDESMRAVDEQVAEPAASTASSAAPTTSSAASTASSGAPAASSTATASAASTASSAAEAAARGEAEVKEEPMDVDEEAEPERQPRKTRRSARHLAPETGADDDDGVHKENGDKDGMDKKKKKKKGSRKIVPIQVEVKEEEPDEEPQFVEPTGRAMRSRACSEMSWNDVANQTAIVGTYGQSTPIRGTSPSGGSDDDGDDDEGRGPPRMDLDISAIAPPPKALPKGGRTRVSRKPRSGTIEE